MTDDFDEFYSRVGTNISIHRECQECGDIVIVNPETYDKPKERCDPDNIEACPYFLSVCRCLGNRMIYCWSEIEECTYPDCDHSSVD